MRDIKFRVFTKEYGIKNVNEINYGRDESIALIGSCGIGLLTKYGTGKEAVIEQYTGIKDINGVEIYEGDIITFHVVMLSPDDKIGYVKYYPEYGYSIMLSRGSLLRQEYWASGDKHTIEVIGNIHEDEKLLH